jgi:hypothetical protein
MMLLPLVAMVVCCCSSDTCTIFTDDFSTDQLATEYTTSAGTWAVSGGKVTCTTASALITCDTTVTGGLTAVFASVTFTPATTSDIGRLVIGYSDGNNYWFAEVQAGAFHGTLKFFQRSAGTDTQKGATQTITGFQATETATIQMCYSTGNVFAYVQAGASAAGVQAGGTITIAGTKCGLGTGSGSSSCAFDDFSFSKHYTDDPTCNFCNLLCNPCPDKLPDTIEVTLPSTVYNGAQDAGGTGVNDTCCNAQNSRTFVLDLRGVDQQHAVQLCAGMPTPSICYYEYLEIICSEGGPFGDERLQVTAWFDVSAGAGTLYVVLLDGPVGGFDVTSPNTEMVYRLTGIDITDLCEGATLSVPFLAKYTTGCSTSGFLGCKPATTLGNLSVDT